ncbi:uncharacterized protein LOC111245514 isoform X4 [Varroa destructor]|uniref:MTMR6-9 GRAM domain-containing protein n=1 Tax=Varroa destructor TaxID=109461 RepID=A0A7M7M534_VARDE|nr:uncharacterized protein LOC111245514 isoform X4 [Varroa destructor]
MYECWIGSMRRSIRWDLCSSPQRTSFSMTLNDAARPGCFTCIYSNTISTFRCSAKSMEKQALTTSGCPLVVRSKNFLSVTFLIPAERQCHDIYQSLLQLSQSVCTSIKQAVRQSELFSLVYQCTYTNYTASTIRHAAKIYPRHSGGTSSRLRKSSNDRECLISSGSKATLIQTIRSDYSDSKSYSQLRVTSFLPTDCH